MVFGGAWLEMACHTWDGLHPSGLLTVIQAIHEGEKPYFYYTSIGPNSML